MKYLLLFSLSSIISIACAAKDQVYTIQSLDGATQKIHLLTDDTYETLRISCLNDTIQIANFIDTDDRITIVDRSFLKIVYTVRSGSGLHDSHTLLLCVSNNKLCQALHVMSLFHEEFIDYSKQVDTSNLVDITTNYELKLSLLGSNSQSYKLNIQIQDSKKSKRKTKTDYNHSNQAVLRFDAKQCIFYNTIEQVSKYFKVYDPKIGNERKHFFKGKFPAIKLLGKTAYYYIKGEWYEKNEYNALSKYSYKI